MKLNMKLVYLKYMIVGLLTLSFAGCNDFLDREPLDQLTPEVFFHSEGDLAAYTINAYNFRTVEPGRYGLSAFKDDNGTDNQAGPDASYFWVPGEKRVKASGGAWDFSEIRSCNYFFDNVLPKYEAGSIRGNDSNIEHYIGEMYVIRAYNYFQKLQDFGDFPIITEALPDKEEVLIENSKRQPRNKVARFILKDLKTATELLQETPPNGKVRVSKNVAHLLRARVALFEATWEKYHKGTAMVPGGEGWPGNKADIEGFDIDKEIEYFFNEAMADAKIVGDQMVGALAVNTDTREGMDKDLNVLNPYYTMFCDVNLESYDEVLMWRQFAKGQVTHNVQMELCRNGGSSGWTRGMVESFLMRNGLPIYADGSEYGGDDQGVNKALEGRDSRISIFTKKDGDVNYYYDGESNIYDKPLILNNKETRAVTGYTVKKGKHYSGEMAISHDVGESGSVVFRGAEALLIYMEASYEVNGNIDGVAERYWKALRNRAKVDEDYNKTIAATIMSEEAKGDWGAYSHGQLIDATLYNIRRERRNELCGEGFRWADIKRWRACDQINGYQIEGFCFWGSPYETAYVDPESGENQVVVDPVNGNVSPEGNSVYLRPYQLTSVNNLFYNGYMFTEAHYLEPIAQSNFRQTSSDKEDLTKSVIYQNPGWPLVAGQGAK